MSKTTDSQLLKNLETQYNGQDAEAMKSAIAKMKEEEAEKKVQQLLEVAKDFETNQKRFYELFKEAEILMKRRKKKLVEFTKANEAFRKNGDLSQMKKFTQDHSTMNYLLTAETLNLIQ